MLPVLCAVGEPLVSHKMRGAEFCIGKGLSAHWGLPRRPRQACHAAKLIRQCQLRGPSLKASFRPLEAQQPSHHNEVPSLPATPCDAHTLSPWRCSRQLAPALGDAGAGVSCCRGTLEKKQAPQARTKPEGGVSVNLSALVRAVGAVLGLMLLPEPERLNSRQRQRHRLCTQGAWSVWPIILQADEQGSLLCPLHMERKMGSKAIEVCRPLHNEGCQALGEEHRSYAATSGFIVAGPLRNMCNLVHAAGCPLTVSHSHKQSNKIGRRGV